MSNNTLDNKYKFRMTTGRFVLLCIFLLAAFAGAYRYNTGLSVTNLNDAYPWGLWILIDLTATAFACVGFSMTLLSRIFYKKEYRIFTRKAVLIAFLSYGLVMMVLIIEVGRWENFWRPLVSPGIDSPMFGVLTCMLCYVGLLFVEIVEIVSEKIAPNVHCFLQKLLPIIVILVCAIPLSYQAYLGSLYFAMDGKLDLLWASRVLPILFVLSAFIIGPVVSLLEDLWSAKRYKREVNLTLLHRLSRVSAYGMIVFLAIRIVDLAIRGQIARLFSGVGLMMLLELLLLSVIPVIVSFTSFGKTKLGLQVFGFSALFGLILSRGNVIFTGMYQSLGGGYFPSWVEIITTIGLVTLMTLIYILLTENFLFFHVTEGKHANLSAKKDSDVFEEAI